MKRSILITILSILGMTAALVFGAQPGRADTPPPQAPDIAQAPPSGDVGFTYQGRLLVGGEPVTGLYDFTFDLFSLASGGTHIAGPLEKLKVQVTNGTFTVLLEFLAANFDGYSRWLEIGVNPPGGSGYTTLTPRQQLTPAPSANFAFRSLWSGIQNLPAGFADGVDNIGTNGTGLTLTGDQFSLTLAYRLPQGCTDGYLPQWVAGSGQWVCMQAYSSGIGLGLNVSNQFSLGLAYRLPQTCTAGQLTSWDSVNSKWQCTPSYTNGAGLSLSGANQFSVNFAGSGSAASAARSDHSHYYRTILVGPSGTDAQNGTALLAALASITLHDSAHRYLISIEPGVYDLGASNLVMKSYVDIKGSSEVNTIIRGAGSLLTNSGTVMGVDNAELSSVRVENYGLASPNSYAVAIYNPYLTSAARFQHVTAYASGAARNIAIYNVTNSSPWLADITATADGGLTAFGVYNSNNSSPAISNAVIEAKNASGALYGIFNDTDCSPTLQQVAIKMTASTSSGTTAYGIYNHLRSSPHANGVTIYSDSAGSAVGISATDYCNPEIKNSDLTIKAADSAYGATINTNSTMLLMNDDISASQASVNHAVDNGSGASTVTVQASRLYAGGGATGNVGLLTYGGATSVEDSVINVAGPSAGSYGMQSTLATLTLNRVTLILSNSSGHAYTSSTSTATITNSILTTPGIGVNIYYDGTSGDGPYLTRIDNSTITGTSHAALAQSNTGLLIGGSHLNGDVATVGTGTAVCVFTYKTFYTAFNAACQ